MTASHPIPARLRIPTPSKRWRRPSGDERYPVIVCVAVIAGLSAMMWWAIWAAFVSAFGG